MTNDPNNKLSIPAVGTAPEGWEMITRQCVVRLGPDLELYYPTNHGSVGITSITVDETNDWLVVNTDFDTTRELATYNTASMDATLAYKGVFSGGSGGGPATKFPLYSCFDLPFYSNGVVTKTTPKRTKLHPRSGVFDSTVDNLWITINSVRHIDGPRP